MKAAKLASLVPTLVIPGYISKSSSQLPNPLEYFSAVWKLVLNATEPLRSSNHCQSYPRFTRFTFAKHFGKAPP